MLSKTAANILQTLLENYPYEYNINQLARMTKMSVGGIHRTLKVLEKNGILYSKKIGNSLFYQLNMENEACTKMLETLQVDRKSVFFDNRENIREIVQKFKNNVLNIALDRVLAMLLFESARGYDILIIASNLSKQQFTLLKDELTPFINEIKKHNFSVIILTLAVFEERLRGRKGFYRNLWNKGVILYGDSFLFQELRRGVVSAMKPEEVRL